jgi:hypothetical protein
MESINGPDDIYMNKHPIMIYIYIYIYIYIILQFSCYYEKTSYDEII